MNATFLIQAVVRQTMVLIATLATTTGRRSPLTQIADQVFASLVRELSDQGLAQKVIADMFGIALRTYHERVARISESGTEQGRSLWEAVLVHVRNTGSVSRAEVLARFHADNDLMVRSVLNDLTTSGLILKEGRGDATRYEAKPFDTAAAPGSVQNDTVDSLVLVAVHQRGPAAATDLLETVPIDVTAVVASLERLRTQGLVVSGEEAGRTVFWCEQCVIPLGASTGWEAAVFDHYQAMVSAIVTKLRIGTHQSNLADKIGGSTFAFDLWEGHPMSERVFGFLQSARQLGSALRQELHEYNAMHEKPPDTAWLRATTYVGQTVKELEDEPKPA